MNFSEVFNLQQLIIFVVIFTICTVGAIAKDVFDGFRGKLLSSLVVSILLWSSSEWFLSKMDLKLFFGVTVLLGMLSYEITGRLTSIDGLKTLIKDWKEFRGKK
jgi:glucose-6-phosphate-specific signal transduction histidine kinase